MTKLAAEYGISDVGLKKICKKMDIPTPLRGYWTRRQHGYKVTKTPLPKPKKNTLLSYAMSDRLIEKAKKKKTVQFFPIVEIFPEATKNAKAVRVSKQLRNPHHLVKKTKQVFQTRFLDKYGVYSRYRAECLNMRVSPDTLNRALRIMSAILKWCETNQFPVTVSQEYNDAPSTSIEIYGQKVEIALFERIKRQDHVLTPREIAEKKRSRFFYAEKWDSHPTGMLSLEILSYEDHGLKKKWTESNKRKLEDSIEGFLLGLLRVALSLDERQKELEKEERRRQEEQRKREEALRKLEIETKKRLELESFSESLAKAEQIRKFVEKVKNEASQREDFKSIQHDFEQWQSWALQHADRVDPIHSLLNRWFSTGEPL